MGEYSTQRVLLKICIAQEKHFGVPGQGKFVLHFLPSGRATTWFFPAKIFNAKGKEMEFDEKYFSGARG